MTQLCEATGAASREYLGLVRVVERIARHPDVPGKRDVVNQCVEDLAERSREGRLTPIQRSELLDILLPRRAPKF